MTSNPYGQNMLLHTSYWANSTTFKLLPLSNDCPYSEVIYDPASTLLVVMSKLQKESFHTVPRLDENGNMMKSKKAKANGVAHQEQRIVMNTLTEYYITEKDEQEAFIKMFAVNADTYEYSKYLRDMSTEPTLVNPETPGLVDASGVLMKK